ncbi:MULTISPECIES: hypothetical protein [Exiguobacterium]|uniref:Uncharacterized protein n=1 Tax=Exiguobacterium aurantiacum TaxID=33987 RepID=A0ABY5FJK7_9BACL|nr:MULTISPECIES: hypothetical protein [Exiguobacterium]UTT41736.1 hypothetical protein NMQ00_09185 [Exiguobacterium aurantiacum]
MRHRNQADSLREQVVDTLPSRAERQEHERKEKLNDNWLKRPLAMMLTLTMFAIILVFLYIGRHTIFF